MQELEISVIENRIGYVFQNKSLLEQVFKHQSVYNSVEQNNQRLEFLGDSLLSYIVSEYAFYKYPSFSEDTLSLYKTLMINYYTLYLVCFELGLQEYLIFNYESLGRNTASIKTYADVVEALIGAIYVDSGSIDNVKNFFYHVILKVFNKYMDQIVENMFDWKGFLQSFLQKKNLPMPEYRVIDKNEEGFFVVIFFEGFEISSGYGKTKKEAEKQAALKLIKKIISEY
ncbi:MAG: ribonuclease III domain-containing protein [bacterium]